MAVNMNIGRLDELCVREENFDCYIECMEQYFIANNILKTKKIAAFLSAMGTKAYKLLQNLVATDSPKDKWFNDLVKMLRAHEAKTTCYYRKILGFINKCNTQKKALQNIA